ncbi:hypothetical protein [Flavisolibacter ginsenosidimutans]|uniref:Uncharacterized protein n=1 Tax=Flavisolibacter ginsenosidimutans TaxID=661481 RepID=A0A5B8UKM8_9BACT|nr:hypothetical protein [Flavisolibacter ginsenosidimutans]QEC57108.1 hypothetical protein FSB75_14750 [Flavisolibacter ginsenosidimutans]
MPNSANRKAGDNKGGTGHKEDVNKKRDSPKPNPERSDVKHDTDKPKTHRGDTSRSSNQGRKEASGGRAEE